MSARAPSDLLEYNELERESRNDSTFSAGRPRVSKVSGWPESATMFDEGNRLASSADIDENQVRLLALFREESGMCEGSDDSSVGTMSGGLSATAVVLGKFGGGELTSSINFDTTGVTHSAGKPDTPVSGRGADATD